MGAGPARDAAGPAGGSSPRGAPARAGATGRRLPRPAASAAEPGGAGRPARRAAPKATADPRRLWTSRAARRRRGAASASERRRRRAATAPAAAPTGAAWPSWSAPTSCSPTSTRCRPTTWARRSAVTCSSRPGCAAALPARALGLAGAVPRPRDPRPPAGRGARRARGAEVDRPQPGALDPTENIYQKRHIAAGIPSIYGNYSEPKFDALGLSFRVENLVGRLFDDLVGRGHRALRDQGLAAPHVGRHPALRARAGRRRRRLARRSTPT